MRTRNEEQRAHDALVEVHAGLLEVEHEQLEHASVGLVERGSARQLALAQHPLALGVERGVRV